MKEKVSPNVVSSPVTQSCDGAHINVTLTSEESEATVHVRSGLALTLSAGNHSYTELYNGLNCTYNIMVFKEAGKVK